VCACSAGVFIAKYWKAYGLSVKHSQTGTVSWSCGFRIAGLASAVACDRQQNYFVRPGAGERLRTTSI